MAAFEALKARADADSIDGGAGDPGAAGAGGTRGLPASLKRFVRTPSRAGLRFCRRGSTVHLLMQQGVGTSLKRLERFVHITEDLSAIGGLGRTSYPSSRSWARLHESAPLKWTLSFVTNGDAADHIDLGVETRGAAHAQRVKRALDVLVRASSARASLPVPTQQRIQAAYRVAARGEVLGRARSSLPFPVPQPRPDGETRRLRRGGAGS